MAVLSMMIVGRPAGARASALPLGIVAGRSERVAAVLSPILDFMQIMPTLAYLTPITLLFLIGVAPSTVRDPDLRGPGRHPDHGARDPRRVRDDRSRRPARWARPSCQVLRKVMLPLSRRPIGLAINQTIMLALSMVVITALIGAPGLGRNLQSALSKVDVGLRLRRRHRDRHPRDRPRPAHVRRGRVARPPRAGGAPAARRPLGRPSWRPARADRRCGLAAPLLARRDRRSRTRSRSRSATRSTRSSDWFTTTFHALTLGIKDVVDRPSCSTRSRPC